MARLCDVGIIQQRANSFERWGPGGVVARPLASHPGGPASITGGVAPGFFPCENRGRRCRWSAGFLGDLSFPPPLHSGAAPYSYPSPSSALNTSISFCLFVRMEEVKGTVQLRVQGQEVRKRYGRQLRARLAPHRSYAQGVQCFRRNAVLCRLDLSTVRSDGGKKLSDVTDILSGRLYPGAWSETRRQRKTAIEKQMTSERTNKFVEMGRGQGRSPFTSAPAPLLAVSSRFPGVTAGGGGGSLKINARGYSRSHFTPEQSAATEGGGRDFSHVEIPPVIARHVRVLRCNLRRAEHYSFVILDTPRCCLSLQTPPLPSGKEGARREWRYFLPDALQIEKIVVSTDVQWQKLPPLLEKLCSLLRLHCICRTLTGSIRRRLDEAGLQARRPLFRLPRHLAARCGWCQEYQRWTEEWRRLVFSDESRFSLNLTTTVNTLPRWTVELAGSWQAFVDKWGEAMFGNEATRATGYGEISFSMAKAPISNEGQFTSIKSPSKLLQYDFRKPDHSESTHGLSVIAQHADIDVWQEDAQDRLTSRNEMIYWLVFASHVGEPGSIPGGFAPGFSHVVIVPDDAAGFLGDPPFSPLFNSGAAPYSLRFTLLCSQDLSRQIDGALKVVVVENRGFSRGSPAAAPRHLVPAASIRSAAGRLNIDASGRRALMRYEIPGIAALAARYRPSSVHNARGPPHSSARLNYYGSPRRHLFSLHPEIMMAPVLLRKPHPACTGARSWRAVE
ncbi:hypothetical protein PR048_022375 [Dryococelus australis]|uniref:Uncharacterized protein n=1 Tax=Dryococelus australis TaxID=614101 RepID=A0ABQ9H0X3_9NEOP|nr:hypothetical protein PR048_022375 [Dryococelus australis]